MRCLMIELKTLATMLVRLVGRKLLECAGDLGSNDDAREDTGDDGVPRFVGYGLSAVGEGLGGLLGEPVQRGQLTGGPGLFLRPVASRKRLDSQMLRRMPCPQPQPPR